MIAIKTVRLTVLAVPKFLIQFLYHIEWNVCHGTYLLVEAYFLVHCIRAPSLQVSDDNIYACAEEIIAHIHAHVPLISLYHTDSLPNRVSRTTLSTPNAFSSYRKRREVRTNNMLTLRLRVSECNRIDSTHTDKKRNTAVVQSMDRSQWVETVDQAC